MCGQHLQNTVPPSRAKPPPSFGSRSEDALIYTCKTGIKATGKRIQHITEETGSIRSRNQQSEQRQKNKN